MICAAPACSRGTLARGLCGGHYARRRRGQSLDAPIYDTIEARFIAKIDFADTGCWLWTASTRNEGRYGSFWLGSTRPAHVVAYELFVGPVPDGCEIDHVCCVSLCVNPAHLEPVTHAENVRRSRAALRLLAVASTSPVGLRPTPASAGEVDGASNSSTANTDGFADDRATTQPEADPASSRSALAREAVA